MRLWGVFAASREWHDSRRENLLVPPNQRNAVHDTRRRDQFIGGVAFEVEVLDHRPANVRVYFPHMQLG